MGKNQRNITQMPEHYGNIVDDQMEKDRQYFIDHPVEKSFIRDYVPGEFYPEQAPICSLVEVTYLAPGIRHRTSITGWSVGR